MMAPSERHAPNFKTLQNQYICKNAVPLAGNNDMSLQKFEATKKNQYYYISLRRRESIGEEQKFASRRRRLEVDADPANNEWHIV